MTSRKLRKEMDVEGALKERKRRGREDGGRKQEGGRKEESMKVEEGNGRAKES